MTAYEKVLRARGKDRPTACDYIHTLFTDFLEMHGDRHVGDDAAIVAGIAMLDEMPVTVIGIEKGHDTADKLKRNFGQAYPEGYRKALRQMKLAEKFGRPVICFVDTAGAFCGIEGEERGQAQAIAENLYEMMTLKVPVLSIIIGEGGSGGALALAVADEVWMLENAYYSVVTPEGCASILWKDAAKADQAAESLKLDAASLLNLEIIEKILSEPERFDDPEATEQFFGEVREQITQKLHQLSAKPIDQLLDARYAKFRKIGTID